MNNKSGTPDTSPEINKAGPPASVSLLPSGDAAWTVEFGTVIDPALHARVLGLASALERVRASGHDDSGFAGIVDIVPTFRSLTVHFNPLVTDGERLGGALVQLAESAGSASHQGRQWRIPVCFDDDYALDLNDLAESKGMSRDAVIS